MNEQIAVYLTRLQKIYLTIDENGLQKDIKRLDSLIRALNEREGPASPSEPKKRSFTETLKLLLNKEYDSITGTKLNYHHLTNHEEVESFIEKHNKAKLLKDTTALDLKLLYSMLTDDQNEIKGTKSEVFEAIKRNIRARKRGEAFKNSAQA